jgi:hypothetical protein
MEIDGWFSGTGTDVIVGAASLGAAAAVARAGAFLFAAAASRDSGSCGLIH